MKGEGMDKPEKKEKCCGAEGFFKALLSKIDKTLEEMSRKDDCCGGDDPKPSGPCCS